MLFTGVVHDAKYSYWDLPLLHIKSKQNSVITDRVYNKKLTDG